MCQNDSADERRVRRRKSLPFLGSVCARFGGVWEEIDSRKLSCLLIRFEENTLEGVLEPENKIFRCVRVVPVFSDGINTFFTSFGCISRSDARERKKY